MGAGEVVGLKEDRREVGVAGPVVFPLRGAVVLFDGGWIPPL